MFYEFLALITLSKNYFSSLSISVPFTELISSSGSKARRGGETKKNL